MVRTVVSVHDYSVSVTMFRSGEMEVRTLSEQRSLTPSDAGDYFTQAIGYFRFAIGEMDCERIEVEMANSAGCVELTEITRD